MSDFPFSVLRQSVIADKEGGGGGQSVALRCGLLWHSTSTYHCENGESLNGPTVVKLICTHL